MISPFPSARMSKPWRQISLQLNGFPGEEHGSPTCSLWSGKNRTEGGWNNSPCQHNSSGPSLLLPHTACSMGCLCSLAFASRSCQVDHYPHGPDSGSSLLVGKPWLAVTCTLHSLFSLALVLLFSAWLVPLEPYLGQYSHSIPGISCIQMVPLHESYWVTSWLESSCTEQFERVYYRLYEFRIHVQSQVFSEIETLGSGYRPEGEGRWIALSTEHREDPSPTLEKVAG